MLVQQLRRLIERLLDREDSFGFRVDELVWVWQHRADGCRLRRACDPTAHEGRHEQCGHVQTVHRGIILDN